MLYWKCTQNPRLNLWKIILIHHKVKCIFQPVSQSATIFLQPNKQDVFFFPAEERSHWGFVASKIIKRPAECFKVCLLAFMCDLNEAMQNFQMLSLEAQTELYLLRIPFLESSNLQDPRVLKQHLWLWELSAVFWYLIFGRIWVYDVFSQSWAFFCFPI